MRLREQIIKQISTIENQSILKEILNLISAETEFDDIYKFSKAERTNVDLGIEDATSGNIVFQKEADNLIKQWLKEKSIGL